MDEEKRVAVTAAEIKQLQNLPLEVKIAKTKQRIREFVQHYGLSDVFVSFSGGKDSTVLLDIARQVYPDIRAVFANTGCEYPEIIKFVKSCDNIIWVHPKVRLKDIIDKYGYPVISKTIATSIYRMQNNPNCAAAKYILRGGVTDSGKRSDFAIPQQYMFLIDQTEVKISDKCCDYLKKAPMKGLGHRITGIKADEGRKRYMVYMQYGCNTFGERGRSNPMGFWTEQDVLEYLVTTGIPYSTIYGDIRKDAEGKYYVTGQDRTGCMGCGFGMHLDREPNRYQQMYYTHPKIWHYYINTLGFGKVFDLLGWKYKPEADLGIVDVYEDIRQGEKTNNG